MKILFTGFEVLKCMAILVVGLLLVSCNNAGKKEEQKEPAAQTYSNPIDVQYGDPYILNDGSGTYYMYGTGGGARDGFFVYSSSDLVNWEPQGQVYTGNTSESWAIDHFWAPEVYHFNDRYYLFFSAQWRDNPEKELENFRIGVAVADSPLGPFEEMHEGPLFDPGYPVIDANVFKDDNGRFYLYYSRVAYKHPVETEIAAWAREREWFDEIEESWVYGVELSPGFDTIIGEPELLLRPPLTMDDKNAEWESRSVTSKEVNRRWTEGSYTFKYNGIYYMMYSANFFGGEHYAVGYATATHPLGPYEKADHNPILEKNTPSGGQVTGTGHNSLVFLNESFDQVYTVYHGRTKETGDERVVFIDRLIINEDGTLAIDGPTTHEKPIPQLNDGLK